MVNDFHTPISIRGWLFYNLHFADEFNIWRDSAAKLQDLTAKLEKADGTCGMEINTEKSKILFISTRQHAATNIMLCRQKILEVDSSTHMGSTLTKNRSPQKRSEEDLF